MIREATIEDIPRVNAILNSFHVIDGASMGTYNRMDATHVLDAGGVILMNEFGGFLLVPVETDIYEAHMFFLKEGRGKAAITAAQEGLRIMFDKYATKITARIPLRDRASRRLTRYIGFKSIGVGISEYGIGGSYESEFFQMEKSECPR